MSYASRINYALILFMAIGVIIISIVVAYRTRSIDVTSSNLSWVSTAITAVIILLCILGFFLWSGESKSESKSEIREMDINNDWKTCPYDVRFPPLTKKIT
jgi:uncharacterized protein (DUF2062 family)